MTEITSAALEALFERIASFRWLEPDLPMSTLDSAAQQFIADRVDEHHEALSRYRDDPQRTVEQQQRTHRSLYDVRFDAGYFGDDWRPWNDPEPEYSKPAIEWVRALDRARQALLTEARASFGSAYCAQLVDATRRVVRGRRADENRADNDMMQRLRERLYRGNAATTRLSLGGELFVYEALATALGHRGSPWAPLLALWERGVATLAGLDGAFLLYVPVFKNGALVPDPDPTAPLSAFDSYARTEGALDEAKHREWRASRAYFHAGRRYMPREWAKPSTLALWATTYRFARHGFAPMPSMMLCAVDSTPMFVATNTPALALTTYVPRAVDAVMTEQAFDAWVDRDDSDASLIEQATPEGLAKRSSGFWDG